jgi:DNA-binding response OmpR family regulator
LRHGLPKTRGLVGPTILIVEDDRRIATLVAKNLAAAGFDCRTVHDGESALREVERAIPALVVLDLMLPGIDGLEIARRLRRREEGRDLPILMLTARSSEGDKVLGLEIGADDYLTKPFSTLELVARVRALLRRAAPDARAALLERGDLRIDPARRAVERDGAPVPLTTLEFDLLYVLASRPGRVFSREALLEHVWGEGRLVDDRSIDSLVSRLRRKLEPDPAHPAYVQTVWGAGYRFVETPR